MNIWIKYKFKYLWIYGPIHTDACRYICVQKINVVNVGWVAGGVESRAVVFSSWCCWCDTLTSEQVLSYRTHSRFLCSSGLVFVYRYICVCACVWIHACASVRVYVCVCVFVCVCASTYIYTQILICMFIRVHVQVCLFYLCGCNMYIYVFICV